jgi:hypothetical protein
MHCAVLYRLHLLARFSPVHVPTAAGQKATRTHGAPPEQSVIDKVGAGHSMHEQGWQWGMIPDCLSAIGHHSSVMSVLHASTLVLDGHVSKCPWVQGPRSERVLAAIPSLLEGPGGDGP